MAKFRLQRLRGGRKHVLTTDSAADYLRCLIDEMAGGFNVLCHVTVTELNVAAAAPGVGSGSAGGVGAQWMRVDVASAPEAAMLDRASEFRFGEFAAELNHVFSKFYECDPAVRAATPDGASRTWTVRHRRDCPWI